MPTPIGSQHGQDEITWTSVGMKLGATGLDLRQPSDPQALTELLNARFVDDRTVEPRMGHTGRTVQDSSSFAPLGPNYRVSNTWVYGHGMQVDGGNAAGWENAHHPMAGRGATTFHWDGSDVVLTGDRLIVMRDGTGLGASSHWNRTGTTTLPYGIPAFLPVQTDTNPPAPISGDYVETCVTNTLRVYVHNGGAAVTAWVVDRTSHAVILTSVISGGSNNPIECKVVNSGGVPVAIWRDYTDRQLYYTYWTGLTWAAVNHFGANVFAWDLAVVPGGFHVLWREGAPSADALKLGRFAQHSTANDGYAFASTLSVTGTPNGPVALGVSPGGDIAILFQTSAGLQTRGYDAHLNLIAVQFTVDSNAGPWNFGLAICSRGLRGQDGTYTWVVHASRGSATGVLVKEYRNLDGTGKTQTRLNATLASKSFTVGDEVFCWLRSTCAGTHYLLAGLDEIAGFADREVAVARKTLDNNYGLPHVLPDPADPTGVSFTWARPFNTGQTYVHGGNVRTGDLNFLPEPTCAEYGRSVYISGSAVRNWDGTQLLHAGFQDYPIVSSITQGTSGVLTSGAGDYYFRVYAVKYNARGERFASAAVTSPVLTLVGANNNATLAIMTLSSSTEAIVYEVYRTAAGGTAFYLDGVVSMDPTVATVSFTVTHTDSELIKQVGDPHAAGVGQLSEIEDFGPIGCSLLVSAGDRLWCAGGQIPAGLVAFSKLKEDGSGAGFDDLAGFQAVDNEGGAITSVAAQNDATVIFQLKRLYVIVGTGPDNYGRGAFNVPQIVLTDGAVNHYGTASTQAGTVYWGTLGPRLLSAQFSVHSIAAPVRSLAQNLTPTGCRVNLARQEVTWYTLTGDALLMSYAGANPRWARWTGLPVAGCSKDTLVTADGRLLQEATTVSGDAGQPFDFIWETGDLRPDSLLGGATVLREIGVVGQYLGEHTLDVRVFYNGSPLWIDSWVWQPETNTWLSPGTYFQTITPAQVDALNPTDRSGAYVTHKRSSRQGCHTFRVRVSNFGVTAPTYLPFELSLELGQRAGLGRVPVNTFN